MLNTMRSRGFAGAGTAAAVILLMAAPGNADESSRRSTVPVKVVNQRANAVPTRDVDQPARSPFQAKVRIELPGDQCCQNGFVDVPAGKRLVIEYASALGIGPAGQTFNFEVGTLLNGHLSFDENHLLPTLQHDPTGTATAGQVVRIYADPGPGHVMLRASRSGTGDSVAFMTVSGHLVALP